MPSKQQLLKAVEKDILQPAQVDPLYEFLNSEANHNAQGQSIDGEGMQPGNGEEQLRFIRSFGDIFISLGIIFFVIAVNLIGLKGYFFLLPVLLFVALAEWLVRVRRLALPGIVILLSILYFMVETTAYLTLSTPVSALVAAITSLMFYLRYSMPFSLLAIAISLVVLLFSLLGIEASTAPVVFAITGIVIFVVAMWFDSKDTRRETRLSDNAFWLHLIAAPLIVHGVMLTVITSDIAWSGFVREILIVLFFIVFFLGALLIDRRALLISTQIYMIFAVTRLFTDVVGIENIVIFVLFFLGLFVIYFGAYWYKTRAMLFKGLVGKPVTRYIPDLQIPDGKRK